MRLTVILLAVVAFAAAVPPPEKLHAADQATLDKQKDLVTLVRQVTGLIPDMRLLNLGQTYEIEKNIHKYSNPIVVQYYVANHKAGLLQPQGTSYSNSISLLRKEVSLLSQVLAGAKDYETFLSTAAWARVHLNPEQFVRAFMSVVLHRPDTQGIVLPPFYEIFPEHYIDTRIIREAQGMAFKELEKQSNADYVIPVNYTAYQGFEENQMLYFTQDVGLASYYGYVDVARYAHEQLQYDQQYAEEENKNIGHGSQYYYLNQQLMARYELNRLSNSLGPIPELDSQQSLGVYEPHVRHLNSLEFPARRDNGIQQYSIGAIVLAAIEIANKVLGVITKACAVMKPCKEGVLYQEGGLNILGDMIEGSSRSIDQRQYGSFPNTARQELGKGSDIHNIHDYAPATIELAQTSTRDSLWFRIISTILGLFSRYQAALPPYQYNDLLLPGVTIKSVNVSRLETLFSDYDVSLDAVSFPVEEGKPIQARMQRLDHKPYEYQMLVHSEQQVPGAVVRLYLGPKYDYENKPVSILKGRHLFVELDQFVYNLKQGENIIVRNSQQAPAQSYDYPSINQILQHVDSAIRSQEPMYTTEPHQLFSFPARLSLPRGRPNGFPVQLFAVISGPGQPKVSYGPVVPEELQTFVPQTFQVIGKEPRGGKETHKLVEVVPDNYATCLQENKAVRTHFNTFYSKQPLIPDAHDVPDKSGEYEIPQQHPIVKGAHPGISVQGVYSTPEGEFVGEGQQHAGGYQDIYAQKQTVQDPIVKEYHQGKHISNVVGGMVSFDGKPLGYPFDRRMVVPALCVPNIHVQDVYIYHKGPLNPYAS